MTDETTDTSTTETGTTETGTTGTAAADTEWVVIRPAGDLESSDLVEVFEGEWRRRADLEDDAVIETPGTDGRVRAYPT